MMAIRAATRYGQQIRQPVVGRRSSSSSLKALTVNKMSTSNRRTRRTNRQRSNSRPDWWPTSIDFEALRSRIRSLDPHPGEWSFPIFAARAAVTLLEERYFYEPVRQYDDLLAISLLNDRLLDAAVLPQHMQHMEVVLDVFPSMW